MTENAEPDRSTASLAVMSFNKFVDDMLNSPQGARITASMFDEMGKRGAALVPDTETDPHLFITQEGITKGDLGEAMREYRALDVPWPGSPWAPDEINVLSTDFINWYRWERL